jgi:ABC-type phosphate/phosphonate transport system permease subunit
MNNLYWDQVGLILLVIFAIVMATELLTNSIRKHLI